MVVSGVRWVLVKDFVAGLYERVWRLAYFFARAANFAVISPEIPWPPGTVSSLVPPSMPRELTEPPPPAPWLRIWALLARIFECS